VAGISPCARFKSACKRPALNTHLYWLLWQLRTFSQRLTLRSLAWNKPDRCWRLAANRKYGEGGLRRHQRRQRLSIRPRRSGISRLKAALGLQQR